MRVFAPVLVAAAYWAALLALLLTAAPAVTSKDVDVVIGPVMVLSAEEPSVALEEAPEVTKRIS